MKKTCTKCCKEFPATNEYFYYRNKQKGELQSYCKSCQQDTKKKWEKNNAINNDRLSIRMTKEEKELIKIKALENGINVSKYIKSILIKDIYSSSDNLKNDAEKMFILSGLGKKCSLCGDLKTKKHFNELNRTLYCDECSKKFFNEYRTTEEHRKRQREYEKKFRKTKKGIKSVSQRNKSNLIGEYTDEQLNECLEFFEYKCAYSGEPLRDKVISKDHIIPLTKNGVNYIWNIAPTLIEINSSKSDNLLEDWYCKQPYFSRERLFKIYKWIEYSKDKYGEN